MTSFLAGAIYILGQCGVPWEDALYRIPADLGNQLITCHWQANGIEVVPAGSSAKVERFDRQAKFEEISNRPKSWPLEQL
jgi:hypothetical protein